ncbi:MAG TPA: peptidoglycan DD-metalloendopeptidase family protein [Dehalococcoidia bacterium]|nr:peptidoglycan DD-metalloendopeptidase family protein [Dehalococcoidia bacterium]
MLSQRSENSPYRPAQAIAERLLQTAFGVTRAEGTPRYIVHLFVVALALFAAILGRSSVPTQSADLGTGIGIRPNWRSGPFPSLPVDGSAQYVRPTTILTTTLRADQSDVSVIPGNPLPLAGNVNTLGGTGGPEPGQPASPPKPKPVITFYTVEAGDTISGLAQRFSVSTESILWANKLANANQLSIGDELTVPPISGVVHTVQSGDTIGGIAQTYGVAETAITEYEGNDLPTLLPIGLKIIVPGGKVPPPRPVPSSRGSTRPAPDPAPAAPAPVQAPAPAPVPAPKPKSSGFVWPTRVPLTTYFSGYHPGIDIAPPFGTPIYAIADGTVVEVVQLNYSYGWYIVVDHGNGWRSMYAHVSAFLVSRGERISQGQAIARVGSTGRSTGPHLHLEMYLNGAAQNPLNYLP